MFARLIVIALAVMCLGCGNKVDKCTMDRDLDSCIALAQSQDPAERTTGLGGLREIASVDPDKVDAAALNLVVEALQDKDSLARGAACRVLAEIGPKAASYAGALTPLLNDSDTSVAQDATRALKAMGK